MKQPIYDNPRVEMLDRAFNYFVNNGLENISMRKLCRELQVTPGSLYYWFDSKDNLLFEAAGCGLRKVADEIFEYAFSYENNLEMFFNTCLDKVSCYKKKLRFIYQMAASPIYGDKMRQTENRDVNYIYSIYAERLAELLGKDKEVVKPLLYMFVSAVLDYVIWEDKEMSEIQLKYIYEALVK